jgi:hypothetical protein
MRPTPRIVPHGTDAESLRWPPMTAFILVFVLGVLAPSLAVAQTRGASPPGAAPVISGMRAHLFQNKTGQLSDDILDATRGGSWNSIAGPNASNATLVVIEVSGPPGGTFTGHFGPQTKSSVRLVARETRRTPRLLLDKTQVVPVLTDQGKGYLAFLVYQSGCAAVRLTATIVGFGAAKPVERSLNFACGE